MFTFSRGKFLSTATEGLNCISFVTFCNTETKCFSEFQDSEDNKPALENL